MWRAKKHRTIELNIPGMKCHCMAPVGIAREQLEQLDKVMIEPDELQSLVYQDINSLTMDQACLKMWVSKTVYAGIYTSARRKLTQAIIDWSVLRICYSM